MLPYSSYFSPQIRNVEVLRCNSNGDEDNSGTYMRISARRYYCNYYMSDSGLTYNTCIIQYRYRPLTSKDYTVWEPILSANAKIDFVDTGALGVGLSADESYEVVVGVEDEVGGVNSTSIILHAGGVFMHKDGELNSIGIGEEVKEENTVSIAKKMAVKVKGTMSVGEGGSAGGTTMTGHSSYMAGDGYGEVSVVVPNDSNTSESAPAYATISHTKAGRVSVKCQPNNMDTTNASVMLELLHNFANIGLQLGLGGDRAFLGGLTEPENPQDATNKEYVDAGLASNKEYVDTGFEPAFAFLPISKGGTGATTAADARANLGVTPTNIGAISQSANYYSSGKSADDLGTSDSLALIPCNTTTNPELYKIISSTYAYVVTLYYHSISQRAQIAISYASATPKMAIRTLQGGKWTPWTEISSGMLCEFDTALSVQALSTWSHSGIASKFYNVTVQVGSTSYRHTFVVDWSAVNNASNKTIEYIAYAGGQTILLTVNISGTSISFKPTACNIVHIRGYY